MVQLLSHHRSWSRRRRLGWFGLLAVLLSCSENVVQPDPGHLLPLSAALVSSAEEAVPGPISGRRLGLAAGSGPSVAWVSMAPGTDTAGVSVLIRNGPAGSPVDAAVIDGGFDPVGVPAAAGDTLQVTVSRHSGAIVTGYALVPLHSRPVVVRTAPPAHKTDVPINPTIQVVFSEPMDSASLSGAVTLSSGGSAIPGHVVVAGVGQDILKAGFVPDEALLPLTPYQLQVSTDARSRDGDALAALAMSAFTTSALAADTIAPIVTVLSPLDGDTVPLGHLPFELRIEENRDLSSLQWRVLDGPLSSLIVNLGAGFWTPQLGAFGYNSSTPRLAPGRYTIVVDAIDAAGNQGSSPPITVTLGVVDTQPRIVVRSFSLVEYQYPEVPGDWFYAPQLVVADAPGQGGVQITGFEIFAIPGFPGRPGPYWARSLTVGPGQDTPLFNEVYGDFQAYYFLANGGRSAGGAVMARLTYRDALSHHYYSTTIQGPIVPGTLPTTFTPRNNGCGDWYSSGDFPLPAFSCPAALRQVVR